jgi:ABC-type anion transport system duplicated permease subunit
MEDLNSLLAEHGITTSTISSVIDSEVISRRYATDWVAWAAVGILCGIWIYSQFKSS